MRESPRTLLQLHYHDRPCGVTQVMRWYARAFRRVFSGDPGSCLLVCAHDPDSRFDEFPQRSLVTVPDAGYAEFASVRAFNGAKKRILEQLLALLSSPEMKKPVVLAAHNMTLMKNAALVSAFAALARQFRDRADQYRFFSIVHDCAEEGRVEQLKAAQRLEMKGIKIGADCFLKGGAVHHVTVNASLRRLFQQCGFAASFLHNPVVQQGARLSAEEKEQTRNRLSRYCRKQCISLDPSRPLFAYPARTIARKNPVEAIAVACLVYDAGLLLGTSGSSRSDRMLHDTIKRLVTRFSLPVITDAQRVIAQAFGRDAVSGIDPVSCMYSVSDAVLSTSIAESFGYYLYEPFLSNLPVVGRRPIGFSYGAGIRNSLLYEQLPVPRAWVDTARLKRKYAAIARGYLRQKTVREVFLRNASRLIDQEYIDFALLDDADQIYLLTKILSSAAMRSAWRSLLDRRHPGWPGRCMTPDRFPTLALVRNRDAVRKALSMRSFEKKFKRCFSLIPQYGARTGNRLFIQRAFVDPRLFRVRQAKRGRLTA
ncbi:MAG: hypothetical protein JW768_11820 [Chitinispirillaceae bacterium]|nr:hypothetical protein [Chitinispirillaceae bacterium]